MKIVLHLCSKSQQQQTKLCSLLTNEFQILQFEIFDFRIEFLQFATFCYIRIRRDCHLIEWPKWNSLEIGKFQFCRWWRCWYFFQYQMQTKSFRQGTAFNCWMVGPQTASSSSLWKIGLLWATKSNGWAFFKLCTL